MVIIGIVATRIGKMTVLVFINTLSLVFIVYGHYNSLFHSQIEIVLQLLVWNIIYHGLSISFYFCMLEILNWHIRWLLLTFFVFLNHI